MIFSSRTYTHLKSRLRRIYSQRWHQQLTLFRKRKQLALSGWVLENADELHDYSAANWFYTVQLENYLFLANHSAEKAQVKSGLSQEEDEVFERWNQSEFADVFLKNLNRGYSVAKASQESLKVLENHLLTLGKRHLLKDDAQSGHYRLQTSLGEKKSKNRISRLLETTISLEGKEITLKTSSLKEMKELSQKIEKALNVIKALSPSSWERFRAFTEVIVPIRIKEFVSYSHQELPGVSMINLYERDFVDLMDDLIHENGHHHLNYYLNSGVLIQEPQEAIYYSPWRRTVRPLRGIYHAYFTFFWGFKLFSDLQQAADGSSSRHLFTEREKDKILFRALEEFWMLEFSYKDLQWARKQKLITPQGWKLIAAQRTELNKMRKKIGTWEKKLKAHKKDLKDLKKELKSAEKKFQKF